MLIRSTALSFCLLAGSALAAGPDVILSDIPDVQLYGQVNGVYGYAIGSHTCNIGNVNLFWTNGGTPGLAMNAFRLHDGRLIQTGLSFVKTACCAAAGSGCGTCNGVGGQQLGAGCLDVYSGWNGGQGRLGPRSAMNPFSGSFSSIPGGSGDAVFRRLQVPVAAMNTASFPGAQYFVEGIYVATDDAANGNSMNNATYKRVTVGAGGSMTPVPGTHQIGTPCIQAWRDHGLGQGQPDPSVTVASLDIPGEGRLWYATKSRSLGAGMWRYEYAVYNLNSDASGASFTIPLPIGVDVENAGFHAPQYHSGELYSNTPWTITVGPTGIKWSTPQTFAQNPNSSALRWGTMYNFWFDATTPPGIARMEVGLFKNIGIPAVTFNGTAPAAPACYTDCDLTGQPNVSDFACFINKFAGGRIYTNCDGSSSTPWLNINDFGCFLNKFAAGCS